MNPYSYLGKMGRRQVKGNWSQFLAVIAIGGIAVTLFVGLLANADSFESRVDAAYDSGNMADAWVTTSSHDRDDEKEILSRLPEGASLDTRFETSGRIGRNLAYPTVVPGIPSISTPYELKTNEGASSTSFVYIDVALAEGADAAKYQIGSSISMSYDLSSFDLSSYKDYLKGYLLDSADTFFEQSGLSLNYSITGIMKFPENIQKAAYSPSIVLISNEAFMNSLDVSLSSHFTTEGVSTIFEYLREMGLLSASGDSFSLEPNQYLITFKNHEAGASLDDIKAYFETKGDDSNLVSVNDRSNMPFVTVVHNDAVQARQFTFLFPFVFFFVGVLVILTTTSQIIIKERLQIGTMKAIGLSKKQIYGHYLLLTDTVVAIGILIGEIVGPLLIPFILDQKYSIIYTLPARTLVVPWLYGALTALGFLAVSSLVTYLICRKEVRLNPAESMRPEPPKIPGKSRLPSLKKPSTLFLSWKMAFRNVIFSKGKSVMVIVGVTGCTALLVCGFGIEDTVNYGIEHDMTLYNNASIAMSFSGYRSKDDIIADLSSIEGADLDRCDPVTRQSCKIDDNGTSTNSYLILLSFDPSAENSHFQLDHYDTSTVAISKKVVDAVGAKLGDTVSFSYQGVDYSAPVGLIYESFAFNGVVVQHDAPFLQGPVTYSGAYVEAKDGYTDESVKNAILAKSTDGGLFSYVTECNTMADWYSQINDVMGGVLIMTNAVKGFGIALALVVLYNLALLSFRERYRDIATLKVLGFSRTEIASSLLAETMTLTLLGVLFGMLLGYPFLLGVMGLNKVELVSYIYTINASSYALSFVLTFVVDFIVNGGLSLLTGKVKMVESLKSVE